MERSGEDFGNRTYNHYVQAFDEFCGWLVTTKRAVTNPVGGLQRLSAAIDVRHQRRALTKAEFSQLVQSARESGVNIQCYDGETRARVYILSYVTKLRRNEIASLTPASFRLNDQTPTLTVDATFSKRRRKDVLPLHPELVAMLRKWLKGIPLEQKLFPKLARRRTCFMVKKDLERVGHCLRESGGDRGLPRCRSSSAQYRAASERNVASGGEETRQAL